MHVSFFLCDAQEIVREALRQPGALFAPLLIFGLAAAFWALFSPFSDDEDAPGGDGPPRGDFRRSKRSPVPPPHGRN